jgi:toxin-antitoxin system PIN domain toxin
VSVRVALCEPDHVNHQIAHDWFADHQSAGWATCPLTENGLVRVTTSPSFFDPPHRPFDVIEQLRRFCDSSHHQFWPDSVSLTDERIFAAPFIRGHKQVTDIYLLGLAKSRAGIFVTLDTSIPLDAVKGARKAHLIVISAAPEESTAEDK